MPGTLRLKKNQYASLRVSEGEPCASLGKAGCPCARMWVTKSDDGRTVHRICIDAGFSWIDHVRPMLPGRPEWCPAAHFGYMEAGSMELEYTNGDRQTVTRGSTYYVPPGHRPSFKEDTVMVEFSQGQTYNTSRERDFIDSQPTAAAIGKATGSGNLVEGLPVPSPGAGKPGEGTGSRNRTAGPSGSTAITTLFRIRHTRPLAAARVEGATPA